MVANRSNTHRTELDDSLAAADAGFVAQFAGASNRDVVNAVLITINIGAALLAGYLLFGVLNYIFFEVARPLPWKQATNDDSTTPVENRWC